MNKLQTVLWLSALWYGAGAALAQTPAPDTPGVAPPAAAPAKATAQSEAGEPRVNGEKPTAQSEAGEPRAESLAPRANPSGKPAASPPRNPAPAAAVPGAPGAPGAQKGANKVDRLELSTATVTGDREQPKVMYIVPWKKSDIGDLEGKPMNSLVDEILSPVDRDVFRREVRYYQTVKPDGSQNGARPPSGQGEK